jgi:lipopolysaccharide/colanic/teichoic acid biosynthesis glycosyltransferase
MPNRRKMKFPILVIGDLILFYTSLILTLWIRYPGAVWNESGWALHWPPFTLLFIIWILTFISLGLYEISITKNEFTFTTRLGRATLINATIAIIIFYAVPYFQITPRANLFIILAISAGLIFAWRHIFNGIIANTSADRILFLGVSQEIAALGQYLTLNPQFAFQPIAYLATEKGVEQFSVSPLYALNGGHNELKSMVQKLSIDTIVASEDFGDNKKMSKALLDIVPLGVRFIHFPIFYEMITGKVPVSLISEVWFLKNFVHVKNAFYEEIKRILDLICAFIIAIPAIILYPFIALIIRLDSPGKGQAKWADENDPRVTLVGNFLRKTRLDELPQLWNVIRGEMSFVGPRPERPEFIETLEKEIPFYQLRHLVSPGLTGWAQINFPYGASVKDALEKLQYDLYYIKERSLALDLDILLRTIVVVFSRLGR